LEHPERAIPNRSVLGRTGTAGQPGRSRPIFQDAAEELEGGAMQPQPGGDRLVKDQVAY
jgi:hypothetical protein